MPTDGMKKLGTKLAVNCMFDIMRNVSGLAVLVIEPVQLENKLPGLGTAVTV